MTDIYIYIYMRAEISNGWGNVSKAFYRASEIDVMHQMQWTIWWAFDLIKGMSPEE